MRRSAWLLGLAAAGAAGVVGRESAAAPVLRKQVDQHGDFAWIGNTVAQECAAGARAPVVGTIGACGTNTGETAPDIFWQSDAPATGQAQANNTISVANARSTAVLNLPAGATVTYARIYWGAQLTTNTPDTAIVLDHIGVFAGSPITADSTASVAHPTSNNTYWYQGTAEITNLISANPLGAYRVSGIDSVNLVNLNSDNPFVAWSLIVFYNLPADPNRNLALFDGLDIVSNGVPASATLTGFKVPNAGFDAKLGVLAYEGDNFYTGDSLLFNGVTLTDGVNPADNFFNGSRSALGSAVSIVGDLPQMDGLAASMSGVDLDIVDITARVAAGQTSATIQATSTGDTYVIGALATSISTYQPDFGGTTKTFTDLNGGGVFRNDVIEYAIVATNSGNDTAVGVVMTDPLPTGVVYVPGSLQITTGANSGAKTDAAGDDQGEYNAGTRTLTVRLGTGANAATGGTMAPGAGSSTTIKFRVTVDTDGPTLIPNQATITASGQKGNPSTGYPTGNGSTTGTPTSVPVDECLVNGDCPVGKPLCYTVPNPNICAVCISDSDCGGINSGKVCFSPGQTCGDGCRGTGGNGCPTGQICSSNTSTIGTCTLPDGGAIDSGNGNGDGAAGAGGTNGADSGDATGGAAGSSAGGAAGSSAGGAAGASGSDGGGAGGAAGASGSDGGGAAGTDGGPAGAAGTDAGRDGSGDGAAGSDGAAGTDGGRDVSGDGTGSGGTGGTGGAGGSSASGGVGGGAGDNGTGGVAGDSGAAGSITPVPGSLEGGGCACSTPGSRSQSPTVTTLLGALAGAALIRRKRRKS